MTEEEYVPHHYPVEARELDRLEGIERAVRHWKKACYRGVTPATQAAWGDVLESLGEPRVKIEACFRSQAAAASSRWLPIETAPKDGTEILAWNGRHRVTVYWHDWLENWALVELGGYAEDSLPDAPPTHWMPLPVFNSQAE